MFSACLRHATHWIKSASCSPSWFLNGRLQANVKLLTATPLLVYLSSGSLTRRPASTVLLIMFILLIVQKYSSVLVFHSVLPLSFLVRLRYPLPSSSFLFVIAPVLLIYLICASVCAKLRLADRQEVPMYFFDTQLHLCLAVITGCSTS